MPEWNQDCASRRVGNRAAETNRSALIRAFCAPWRPSARLADASGTKYFSRGRRRHVDFSARRKTRANDAAGARGLRATRKTAAEKTLDSSAFLQRVGDVAANRAHREISCRVVAAMTESRIAARCRMRQLRTNPSGVTVIFFRL
jgi:hypothetical protein